MGRGTCGPLFLLLLHFNRSSVAGIALGGGGGVSQGNCCACLGKGKLGALKGWQTNAPSALQVWPTLAQGIQQSRQQRNTTYMSPGLRGRRPSTQPQQKSPAGAHERKVPPGPSIPCHRADNQRHPAQSHASRAGRQEHADPVHSPAPYMRRCVITSTYGASILYHHA